MSERRRISAARRSRTGSVSAARSASATGCWSPAPAPVWPDGSCDPDPEVQARALHRDHRRGPRGGGGEPRGRGSHPSVHRRRRRRRGGRPSPRCGLRRCRVRPRRWWSSPACSTRAGGSRSRPRRSSADYDRRRSPAINRVENAASDRVSSRQPVRPGAKAGRPRKVESRIDDRDRTTTRARVRAALQRGAALQAPRRECVPRRCASARPLRSAAGPVRSKWWTIGFAIAFVAWGLHVAALALAPLSLVQAVIAGGIALLAIPARHMVRDHARLARARRASALERRGPRLPRADRRRARRQRLRVLPDHDGRLRGRRDRDRDRAALLGHPRRRRSPRRAAARASRPAC